MFKKALAKFFLLLALTAATAIAQDANTAIHNAEKAMGDVKSIRYAGSGRWGVVGMNWNTTAPWHPTVLNSYIRTIDYPSGSSRELITRNQENPPALGGEAPFVDEIKEGHEVRGKYAWNQPGNANPMPPPEVAIPALATADERTLQIFLTPHGFLNGALDNHATAKTENDGGKNVRLTVQDSGIGFVPDVADRLFESFYTTKENGMGVGLSVSRSIIEAHRGRLWASANDGPGASFAFSIPQDRGAEPA